MINYAGPLKMYPHMPHSNPKSTIKGQIDENLKRIYDETLKEQIPDKLLALLQKLNQKAALPAQVPPASDDDQDPS